MQHSAVKARCGVGHSAEAGTAFTTPKPKIGPPDPREPRGAARRRAIGWPWHGSGHGHRDNVPAARTAGRDSSHRRHNEALATNQQAPTQATDYADEPRDRIARSGRGLRHGVLRSGASAARRRAGDLGRSRGLGPPAPPWRAFAALGPRGQASGRRGYAGVLGCVRAPAPRRRAWRSVPAASAVLSATPLCSRPRLPTPPTPQPSRPPSRRPPPPPRLRVRPCRRSP
jgi:hypothetical protein